MSTKPTGTFSERETTLLVAYFQSLKEQPECDYAKMAEIMGLKNKKSCADTFRPVLKKLMAGAANASPVKNGNDEAPESAVKATPNKKRKAATTEGDTPAKKRSQSKKVKKVVEEEDAVVADDQEEADGADGGVKKEEGVAKEEGEVDDWSS
ncbi:hypothetical protein MBLNU230_g1748t1 [Neophaeotheca triangularis]